MSLHEPGAGRYTAVWARLALRERRGRPRFFRTTYAGALERTKSTMQHGMKRREALRVLGLGGLATLMSACQPVVPQVPAEPTPPPVTPLPAPTVAPTEITTIPGIRLAIDQDPDTLDPAGQMNPTTSSIVEHLAETLVRLLPDGTIAAGLARKFSQSTDGKVYTFELRPDVEFHDGSTLDAEAASLSLRRFIDPQLRVSMR